MCRLLPRSHGLPRFPGGSASASSRSRPAQASRALRPAGLLNRPRRPLSPGSSPVSCPTKPLVSYRSNRQLSGWNPPPLVIRAVGAHKEIRALLDHLAVIAGGCQDVIEQLAGLLRRRCVRSLVGWDPEQILVAENFENGLLASFDRMARHGTPFLRAGRNGRRRRKRLAGVTWLDNRVSRIETGPSAGSCGTRRPSKAVLRIDWR